MNEAEIRARLEYLRSRIRAESIAYGEIADLQGLAEHIDPSDVELLEWAGVPEFGEERSRAVRIVVNVDGSNADDGGAEYLRYVADQIEAGFTSGHVDSGTNWDSDGLYSFNERD